MNIVCFGGNGTLGKELQKINGKMFCPPSNTVNIEDKAEVEEFIRIYKPEIVINAAAIIDNRVLENIPDKAISTNIIGAANVANVCIEKDIRYVYISTDYVYKGDRGNYKEEDEVLPFNFYAWTKLGGEASAKGVKNHLIIRVSFGKSQFSYPVAFVDKWSSKDYVDIIAQQIYDAAISPITGVLNLGTDRKTLFSHAKERNEAVKPIKLSETSFFTPYDTSLNLQKWEDYIHERSVCKPHTQCRACSGDLIKYLDLGMMPLSNNLEATSLAAKASPRFPLQVMRCKLCGLSQLSVIIDPKVMFSHYVYRSSVNRPYVEHCRKMAQKFKSTYYGLSSGHFHIDIAGNDGTLLKEFKEEIPGLKVLNIDPASNLAAIAEAQGIPTIADFWTDDVGDEIKEKYGEADLITATNVFAHVDGITHFLITAKSVLKPNGILVIECPYIVDHIEKLEYNQTYFEHLSYISLWPIVGVCMNIGLKVIDVEKQDIHGGTIRIVIGKEESGHDVFPSVREFLDTEDAKGYNSINLHLEWAKNVKANISDVRDALLKIKKEGKSIVGIGASAKGNTLLNALGVTTDIVDAIIDETAEKIGKFSPGTGIPIVHKRYFAKNKPDYVIILAENFKEELIKKAREAGYEGKFIISIPTFEII